MRTTHNLKAVYAVLGSLQRALGSHLKGLYSFGGISACTYCTASSGGSLLVVVSDDTTMRDVHQALQQVWNLNKHELGQVPLIARESNLAKHLELDPLLAYDLQTTGEKFAGETSIPVMTPPEPIDLLARITMETMRASSVLAPAMIAQQELDRAINSLLCLAAEYLAEDISPMDSSARIFAAVQRYVSYQISRHDELSWTAPRDSGSAPVLEVLLSVYSNENRLLLLLPDLPADDFAERITSINWGTVAGRIAGEYRGLQLSTPAQLRLALSLEGAAEYALGTYELAWGVDVLAGLEVERWRLLRDLARLPSTLLVDTLPRSLIVCKDNDLPVLVHDLQNKLLNIQLRNELFSRMEYSVAEMPPDPLPDRNAPSHVRIEAIAMHLEWWTNYYLQEMKTTLALGG